MQHGSGEDEDPASLAALAAGQIAEGELGQGLRTYLAAEDGFERAGELENAWIARLNRATAMATDTSQVDEALSLLDQLALDVEPHEADLGRLVELRATIVLNRGWVRNERGDPDLALVDFELAERLYGEAATSSEEAPRRALVARYNRAAALSAVGRLDESRQVVQRAVGELDELGEAEDLAYACRILGGVLGRLGRFGDATEQYRRAYEIFERLGHRLDAARTQIGWAQAVAGTGDLDGAAHLVENLIGAQHRGLSGRERAMALLNLGGIRNTQRRYAEALVAYDEASALFEGQGDRARVDINRAVAMRHLGRPDDARSILEQAVHVLETAGLPLSLASAMQNLARCLVPNNSAADPGTDPMIGRALDLCLEALDIIDRTRYELGASTDRVAWIMSEYRAVYGLAIPVARLVGDAGAAAALVELARGAAAPVDELGPIAQPAPHRSTSTERRFPLLAPTSIAAAPGGRAVPVDHADPIVLATTTRQTCGGTGAWFGTYVHAESVQWAVVTSDGATSGGARRLPGELLEAWLSCLGVPSHREVELADAGSGGDDRVAQRLLGALVLARVASLPLLRRPDLQRAATRLLPDDLHNSWRDEPGVVDAAALGFDGLRHEMGAALVPNDLHAALDDLGSGCGLAVAPDWQLGRVPWGLLPIGPSTDATIGSRAVVRMTPASSIVDRVHERPPPSSTAGHLAVVNPSGDLTHADVPPHADRTLRSCTRSDLLAELDPARTPAALTYIGHVDAGPVLRPELAALRLNGRGADSRLTALDVVESHRAGRCRAPVECAVLACESAGVTASPEWSALAPALLWAGAERVLSTLWPLLDCVEQRRYDQTASALLLGSTDPAVRLGSLQQGWLTEHSNRPDDRVLQPHHWAGLIVAGVARRHRR